MFGSGDVEKKVVALRRLFMWRDLKGRSVRFVDSREWKDQFRGVQLEARC